MILMDGEEKKRGRWYYFLSQIGPLQRIDYPLKDHKNSV